MTSGTDLTAVVAFEGADTTVVLRPLTNVVSRSGFGALFTDTGPPHFATFFWKLDLLSAKARFARGTRGCFKAALPGVRSRVHTGGLPAKVFHHG